MSLLNLAQNNSRALYDFKEDTDHGSYSSFGEWNEPKYGKLCTSIRPVVLQFQI